MEKQILNALNARYATKRFDPEKKLSESQLSTVLDAARLTPTSYGLQLMKVVVVEAAEKRKALLPYSFAQKQVVDASHLLVLCREKIAEPAHIEAYITNISTTREIPEENLEGFKKMMLGSIADMSEEAIEIWMDKQVYITLGNLLNICAFMQIDSCPMEGFQVEAYNKELGLDDLNLSAVLVLPIGYRSENDANAKHKKVRRSNEDFVVRM
ncbi:MAG: NAD(P)H-dependent oxidoreductase [Crocinitomix sp.]|nr:NAD(P)H-dependent oxidoreductase [Crocinitomix sp.]